MVAPRTRAERPADTMPAPRPARKAPRRVAAETTIDRSPPSDEPAIASGNGKSAPPRRKANGASVATASRGDGATGSSGTSAVAEAPRRRKSAVEAGADHLIDTILKGTPHMPGYGKQISAAQAADLTAYVRTLGK